MVWLILKSSAMIRKLDETQLKDATHYLVEKDAGLKKIFQQYGYPPLWDRPATFASLVHIILEQQVSLASARAAYQNLHDHLLGYISPDNFLTINDEKLRAIGFSRQKTGYTRGVANAIQTGALALDTLHQKSDDAVKQALMELKGIGHWTADIYMLMCLQRPDVLPCGDIALYEAYRVLYQHPTRPQFAEFEKATAHWKPFRSVGARLLWHFYLSR
jgi:DNA-3-methyladenine glycosylase II